MSNKNNSNSDEKEIKAVEAPVETSKQEDESSIKKEVEKESPKKPTQSKTKEGSGKGLLVILLILVIVVIAAAAYYFWDIQYAQSKKLKQQSNQLSSLSAQIDEISQNVKKSSQMSSNHSTKLAQLADQLKQTEVISQQAIEVVNRSQRDWALSEIDYLLRMGHRRLEVARDISGAIAALKGADSRIKQLADLNLFKIRKQLAKDIAGLNAIQQADVNGISLSIDQLISYLPELPFKSIKDEIKVQTLDSKIKVETESNDQSFVDSVLETVKQIGDIKVHQKSIQAASGAEQQNHIEQLLRTYLLSARLAALRFDQIQFLHEVNQASEIVRLHYNAKDNRVQQLQKTLSDYSALQLTPDLPELTKAWAMLQKEIENKDSEQEKESEK